MMTCVHLSQSLKELWPSTCVRISFPLNILRRLDGIQQTLAYIYAINVGMVM